MKVSKIMTKNVGTCRTNESLAKAVEIMWQKDCGIVPVIDKKNKVMGTITDRDISIALTTRNRLASEITTGEVINGKIITCSPKDKVKNALKKMRKHQIKRLPVVKKNEKLVGIISITDILSMKKNKSLKKEILKTFEAISKPAPILFKAAD